MIWLLTDQYNQAAKDRVNWTYLRWGWHSYSFKFSLRWTCNRTTASPTKKQRQFRYGLMAMKLHAHFATMMAKCAWSLRASVRSAGSQMTMTRNVRQVQPASNYATARSVSRAPLAAHLSAVRLRRQPTIRSLAVLHLDYLHIRPTWYTVQVPLKEHAAITATKTLSVKLAHFRLRLPSRPTSCRQLQPQWTVWSVTGRTTRSWPLIYPRLQVSSRTTKITSWR